MERLNAVVVEEELEQQAQTVHPFKSELSAKQSTSPAP
jgi:hypothetical protein